MPRRTSFTQIGMWLKCGQQFDFRYVKGIKNPPALAMLRGRGQHVAQEIDLGKKILTGALADEPELTDAAADKVREDAASKDDVQLDADEKAVGFTAARDKTIDLAVRATQLHHRNVAPVIEPAATELKLEFQIPMPDQTSRDVLGYADIREKNLAIRDTKTTMKKPAGTAARDSDQLALYAYANRVLTGEDSPRQSLDVLVLSGAKNATEIPIPKPKKGEVKMTAQQAMKAASAKLVAELSKEQDATLLGLNGRDKALRYEGTQTHNDQARTILRVQEALAGIEAGFFPPAPMGVWWCSKKWCGYYDVCPYVRGGAVVTVPGVNE